MSKVKTKKAIVKRFKISAGNKVTKRRAGQDHFNSKEPGKITRKKRRDIEVKNSQEKNIKTFIPYHNKK